MVDLGSPFAALQLHQNSPLLNHLGLSWGLFGAVLGNHEAILGDLGLCLPPCAILSYLGAILGPSWAILGPCWGRRGASWGHLGVVLALVAVGVRDGVVICVIDTHYISRKR